MNYGTVRDVPQTAAQDAAEPYEAEVSSVESRLYQLSMTPCAQWLVVLYLISMCCVTAFVVGYGMDLELKQNVDPLSITWFVVLESVVDSLVFLEVALRILVYKRAYFNNQWAMIDLIIAVACIATMVIDLIRRNDSNFVSTTVVNILRVVRGFARILRLVHFISWLAQSYVVLNETCSEHPYSQRDSGLGDPVAFLYSGKDREAPSTLRGSPQDSPALKALREGRAIPPPIHLPPEGPTPTGDHHVSAHSSPAVSPIARESRDGASINARSIPATWDFLVNVNQS